MPDDNSGGIAIRPARPADIPAVRAMQERSLRVLGAPFYTDAEVDTFLREIGTMDDAVVYEGHYFVATGAGGAILGSGGWSRKAPGYDRARASGVADEAAAGAATVRSVFVDPAATRRGIARAIMERVERNAVAHGIGTLGMMATLSGVAFYARLGYRPGGEKTLALPGGLRFGCVSMSKPLVRTPLQTLPHRADPANTNSCRTPSAGGTLR
jgi:GNAT superfamily N-acetyltransferase